MSQRDPYDILGVRPEATDAEITAAYRKLARRHHPDQHPGDSAEQRRRREAQMAEINVAHAALLDGWTRPRQARPDTSGTAPLRPRVPPPPPPRPRSAAATPEAETGEPVSPWRVFGILGIGAAVLVVLAAIVVAVISPEGGTTVDEEEPVVIDAATWVVGTCVTDGTRAEAVRCELPHRGMVIADVFNIDQCPADSDAAVADPPRVLCLDFDA